MAVIGVDLGGTKIAAGIVDDSGFVRTRLERPTPAGDGEATTKAVTDIIKSLQRCNTHEKITAVGVAVAGMVDSTRTVVLHSANIAGWRNQQLAATLCIATGLPVVLENDAHATAWAEVRALGKATAQDFVLVTVGTGLGGAIVADGALRRGAHGLAGEVGHMPVGSRRSCPCGGQGCWERYASGSALVAWARRRSGSQPSQARVLLGLAGKPERITGRHVMQAARAGDPTALAAFDEIGSWLGKGLAMLASVLDPERFVLSGGVADADELLIAPARAAYSERLLAKDQRVPATISRATAKQDAAVIGAALLARDAPAVLPRKRSRTF